MTAVLSGLTQPIEQEALLHRKPASRTTVRVPTGTRQSYPQGQNGQRGFLKFAGYGLDNRGNLREHYCDNYLVLLMHSLRTAVCPYAFDYKTNHCTDRTCYARTF